LQDLTLRLVDPAPCVTPRLVGGTPPFAHRQPVPVLIDRGVMDLEEIYAGGGADDVMLRLRVIDLLQATGARLLDVI